MNIIRYSSKLRLPQPHAIAIGNFDGIHRGHQQLLAKLITDSDALGLPALVCTFYPLPWQWLATKNKEGNLPLDALHNLRTKVSQLQANKINNLVIAHFTDNFRRLSPQTFIQDFLVNSLNTAHLITGTDFRFGFERRGNKEQLFQAQRAGLFSYASLDEYPSSQDKISSSTIREYLTQGDLESANQLLGYDYYIMGKVVPGNQQGVKLGFPTANINLKQFVPPLKGVFVCMAYIDGEAQGRPAVANLGYRPTMNSSKQQGGNELEFSAEAHLLHFNQNIYGKILKLVFVKYLRSEKKFAKLEELVQQIGKDVEAAEELLS